MMKEIIVDKGTMFEWDEEKNRSNIKKA